MADSVSTSTNNQIKEDKSDKTKQSLQTNPTGKNPNKDKKPEGNRVWVSFQKRPPFYGNIALRMFLDNETVELHGLGNAISSAVEVSQYIIPTGKAILQKIHTSTVQTANSRKPEIVITLHRTPKALEQPNEEFGEEEEEEDQQYSDY